MNINNWLKLEDEVNQAKKQQVDQIKNERFTSKIQKLKIGKRIGYDKDNEQQQKHKQLDNFVKFDAENDLFRNTNQNIMFTRNKAISEKKDELGQDSLFGLLNQKNQRNKNYRYKLLLSDDGIQELEQD